jgi:hypothetical protein
MGIRMELPVRESLDNEFRGLGEKFEEIEDLSSFPCGDSFGKNGAL